MDAFKSMCIAHWDKYPECNVATITITEDKPKRSDAQNRLFSRWVDIIRNHTGNSKQEMRLILGDMFLEKIEFTTNKGKQISQIPSTKELKVAEFVDLLFEVEMFANEWGINLEHDEEYQLAVYGKTK
jgi:hypothetical protein